MIDIASILSCVSEIIEEIDQMARNQLLVAPLVNPLQKKDLLDPKDLQALNAKKELELIHAKNLAEDLFPLSFVTQKNVEQEKAELKQLEKDPFSEALKDNIKIGKVVTCVIENVLDTGLEVSIDKNLSGFIKRAGLSRDKDEQKSSRFAKGEKVDAMITSIDANSRKLLLSIKAMELEDEKQAMKDYGSADSGASLGDILGAALEAKSNNTTTDMKKEKKVANEKNKEGKEEKK